MGKKERNIYKGIVIIAAALLLFVYARGRISLWVREQKSYGFFLESQAELTKEAVGEFANFLGIRQFLPSSSAQVTLKLEEYTLEAKLQGIDLDEYPLQWQQAEQNVCFGGTAALFLGKGCFASFVDQDGHGPTKSRIGKWMARYRELSVTVSDETGQEKQAKVFGILKEPEGIVCMDKGQMEEIFGGVCRVKGGYMQVHGYRNTQAAKKTLEQAGFLVEGAPPAE